MDAYSGFAAIYDVFMAEVPYDEWVLFIEKIWSGQGLMPSLVLELGCGTGNITKRLAQKGYDMIGVDSSIDMLSVARQKSDSEAKQILYLQQDMCGFELYGTVDSCLCLCDSINYLTDGEDIKKMFSLVKNYLNPEGLFIFDINTRYKYEQVLGNETFAQATEEAAYIWENYYDKTTGINTYEIDFFMKDTDSGLYQRFSEEHTQKAYGEDQIEKYLKDTGFSLLEKFDGYSSQGSHSKSEKIVFAAKA